MIDPLQPDAVGTTQDSTGLKGFITELRQRNVVKVGVAYAITGWLIIEVVNNTFPVFDFPRWTSQFAILLVILGFPVALVFAWIFELTPQGLRTTASADTPPAYAALQGQKLNTFIVGLIGIAVAFLLLDRFVLTSDASTGAMASAPAAAVAGTPRLSIVLPVQRPLRISGWPNDSLALSPDGSTLAYTAFIRDRPTDSLRERSQLFVRTMNSRTVSPIPQSEGSSQPFFAPDGQSLAFFTSEGELKRANLSGGAPVTLVEGLAGGAWSFGAWTDGDNIVYSDRTELYLVPATGGVPKNMTTINPDNKELNHIFPSAVPGAEAVVFTVNSEPPFDRHLEVLMLDSGERRLVLDNASGAHVLASGHLIFQRDTTVMVAPFDLATQTVTGPAVTVPDSIRMDNPSLTYPQAQLAVARNGTLAYLPEENVTGVLGTLTPGTRFESFALADDYYAEPRVAPDGLTMSFVLRGDRASVLYTYDMERGTTSRLSQDGAEVQAAAWRPDGNGMAIAVTRQGISLLGNGSQELLVPFEPNTSKRNMAWTPDGRELVYTRQQQEAHDIWVHHIDGSQPDHPLLAGPKRELDPALSPDGRWLAFTSAETGMYQIYVLAYPDGDRYTVSRDGGSYPVWSADGSSLFFVGLNDDLPTMMRVDVATGPRGLQLSSPQAVFPMEESAADGEDFRYSSGDNATGAGYDILPDGRFLLVRSPKPENREIVIVQNWFDEVGRLAPAPTQAN